ncbi:MAG: DUF4293 domain-containing protein [Bacteroidales bacterium]|nr:DUF4293 domain-containing protein [Bacteroidales bacterium]
MIQRIQSIFLFAAFCFMVSLFFATTASLVTLDGEIYDFRLTGFYQTYQDATERVIRQVSLTLYGCLICGLNVITIFMYKRRVLQMRLCIYNIILIVGIMGLLMFIIHNVKRVDTVVYHLPVVFPAASAILHYLAYRSIRRDDLMVQALSRLR